MGVETIVLNVAYVALLGSTQMRTIRLIRITLLLGAVGFTTFGVLSGIWSMLVWNLVTSTLHIVSLVRETRRGRPIELTAQEERWRRHAFPDTSPQLFRTIWAAGRERRMTDASLTTQGEPPEALTLILDGTVEVREHGQVLANLRSGEFVGEMGTLRGTAACADAAAVGDLTARQWPAHALASLDAADPAAAIELRRVATVDALAKLL